MVPKRRQTAHIFVFRSDKPVVKTIAPNSNVREKALECLGQLPPFSPILMRVLASLAREDVSFAKLADLIEKDTVLAGNILRLVNSALYGLKGTVNSVRHSVNLLGITKVRNVTLGLSVARIWSSTKSAPGWSRGRFNLHSLAVAILADLLSQEAHVNYPEGAFTAGLFHDLGHLLIAVGLPTQHAEVMTLLQRGYGTLCECEKDVLDLHHAELSAEALAIWNLPLSIQTAVRYHHDADADPTVVHSGELRLSQLVQAADLYANQIGLSIDTLSHADDDGEGALAELGVGGALPGILEQFENEFAAIRKMF
jgi:HD-like signal output (HDOD) protein